MDGGDKELDTKKSNQCNQNYWGDGKEDYGLLPPSSSSLFHLCGDERYKLGKSEPLFLIVPNTNDGFMTRSNLLAES